VTHAVTSTDSIETDRIRPRLRGRSLLTSSALVFGVVGTILGLLFIAMNPPYWGNDGMSQFARAFQVAHGHLAPEKIAWGNTGDSYGGDIPSTAWKLYEHAGTDLGQNPAEPSPIVLQPDVYRQLESAPFDDGARNTVWFTNTAAYSPVPYVPAAIGVWIATALHLQLGTGLDLMAVLSLLSYVAAVTLGLRALRGTTVQWFVFALAMLPPALLQMSTITADALTNGLAILVFALFAKTILLKQNLTRFESWLLLVSAIALPLGKPTYALLSALVCFIPARRLFRGATTALVAKWVALGVAGVAWAAWTVISGPTSSVLAFYRSDYATSQFGVGPQLSYVLHHPIAFVKDLVRTFVYRDNFYYEFPLGSSGVQVPGTAMLLGGSAVVLAGASSERFRASRRDAVVLVTVSALSIVAIFATLFVSFTPVGYFLVDGVQGRYVFPLLPYIGAAILVLVPLRLTTVAGRTPAVGGAVTILSIIAVLATLLKFYVTVWG